MKLRTAGLEAEAETLENCHISFVFQVCSGCSTVRKFANRCDNFFCPECQPGLAKSRAQSIEWWTETLTQPKHVVLTVRNVGDLCAGHVKEIKKWFSALRRRKFARNWKGGFYSLEVTNEGNGWHLHIHALVEAKYIPKAELVLNWMKVTRGAGRICDVSDARDKSYLKEVTKYAVKGSQLAAWSPDKIRTFVQAFKGMRTFGVFGQLYRKRTIWKDWIQARNLKLTRCKCGCDEFRYYDEHAWMLNDLKPSGPICTRPPPQLPDPQIEFSLR